MVRFISLVILVLLFPLIGITNSLIEYPGVYQTDVNTYAITQTINIQTGDEFILHNVTINSYVCGPTFQAEGVKKFILDGPEVWLWSSCSEARVFKCISCQWGRIPFLIGNLLYPNQKGIEETTIPGELDAIKGNSMHNSWGQIEIKTAPRATDSIGWEMTSSTTKTNTCWDVVSTYIFWPTHKSQIGLELGCADTNTFTVLGAYGGGSTAVRFNYTCFSMWPNGNTFISTDTGTNKWINKGTPNSMLSYGTAKNVVLKFGRGNGATKPSLFNLQINN